MAFGDASHPVVSVRGEAVLEVEPEIAHLGVTVTARSSQREKALNLLNERGMSVGRVLKAFEDSISAIETASIRVGPRLKSDRAGERVIGYVATLHHRVTVTAFGRLGELVAQLADNDLAELTGPWWDLRPDSPVHRRARTAAVQDAVRRGRDYARALGTELSSLVELADSRLLTDSQNGGALAFRAAASHRQRRDAAPEEFTFDIAPARQVVRASVEARFLVNPPDVRSLSFESG